MLHQLVSTLVRRIADADPPSPPQQGRLKRRERVAVALAFDDRSQASDHHGFSMSGSVRRSALTSRFLHDPLKLGSPATLPEAIRRVPLDPPQPLPRLLGLLPVARRRPFDERPRP